MKIIFLEAVQNYGGARISTLELAERLSVNHEVLIVDFYGSCEPFLNAVDEKKLKVIIVDKRNEPVIIRSSLSKIRNFIKRVKFIPHWLGLRKSVNEIIKEYNADIVLVNNYKTLSVLYGLKAGYRTIFFARGWFVPQNIGRFKSYLLKSIVDKYICVSEATRHALFCGRFASLEDLYVVHNAIDEDKLNSEVISLKADNNEVAILHAGGFLPEKGQHVSIEVARILKEKGVNFKLILAGLVYKGERSERYFDQIDKMINELSLQQDVMIVKNKTNVIPYFRGCDIVIHPSATEGLPRVVMEAMCLKKPVIANPVGGVTDFILSGYTGYITNYNDPEDYASYIKKLVDNPELYSFISTNGYNLIKTSYTRDKQIAAFDNILNII